MKEFDYKKLFAQSPTAIAYHKIILDENNRPCDYEFLEVNPSFEKLTGLKKENIVNKKVTELFPEVKTGEFDWIAFYGDIALNGGRREFEAFFKPLNSWLRVTVHSSGQNHFITHLRELDKKSPSDNTKDDYLSGIDEKKLDYQAITDRVKEISGAKYVFCNIYDKEEKLYKAMAVAGNNEKTQKALSLLGIEVFNWKWTARNFGDFYEKELVKTNNKLQKSMEKANKMAAEAEKANELKSQFLANMSHEIRTPLNIIMGYTQIMAKELEEDNYKRYIKSIRSAGESLLDQVNDILDMSKIEAGMIEINYEFIDLAALLENITAIFANKVKAKGLDFQLKKDNLPPLIKLDEVRFRQIMINLLDNAVKFTKSGHISIEVYCQPADHKDEENIKLLIIVQDSGVGIKKEKQAEIFKAFSQENAESTREFGGTGLGLSITRCLIKMMDGQISLQSREGKGSVFKIEFSALEYKSENKSLLLEAELDNERHFSNAAVLVVDDEKSNRELLKDRLNKKGIQVIEAVNGREAYQINRDKKPDLVIMDLKMPGIDGYQALEKLRADQNTAALSVVALTAAATEEEQKNANQAGFDDFICKPLLEEDLLKMINRFLIDD